MISRVELRRIAHEWRTRLQRVQQILQPSEWAVDDWNRFARALTQMVRAYGSTWTEGDSTFWDVRWTLQDGGELICQTEVAGPDRGFRRGARQLHLVLRRIRANRRLFGKSLLGGRNVEGGFSHDDAAPTGRGWFLSERGQCWSYGHDRGQGISRLNI
jgi:hypothetical protein